MLNRNTAWAHNVQAGHIDRLIIARVGCATFIEPCARANHLRRIAVRRLFPLTIQPHRQQFLLPTDQIVNTL
jgi:hypothetical protein